MTKERKNNYIINEDNNNPANEDIINKAEKELDKRLNNKNILSPDDARKLKYVCELSPNQFEVLYENYLMNFDSIEESIQPTTNFVSSSITNNKDSMYYKIDDFVKKDNFSNLLSFEEFCNVIRGWITYDYQEKTIEEWYEEYKNKFFENPNAIINYSNPEVDLNMIAFRSKNKIKKLQNKDNSRPVTDNHIRNTFPLKENKNKYQLHKTSKSKTYLIDIMYCDKLLYLLAINVNTRYLFAELLNEKLDNNNYSNTNLRTNSSILQAIHKMQEKGLDAKYLSGDGEKAFLQFNRNELGNIKWIPVRRILMGNYPYYMKKQHNKPIYDPMHNSLGIIDRVIRTLRDMAYNIKVNVITPDIMDELVEQYNNAPHRILSEYAGYSVSPKQVQEDPNLESFIVRRICQSNYNVQLSDGFYLEPNTKVDVFNEKDTLRKRRTIVQPGNYTVQDFNNGVYTIQGDNKIQYIPRYKLLPKKK